MSRSLGVATSPEFATRTTVDPRVEFEAMEATKAAREALETAVRS